MPEGESQRKNYGSGKETIREQYGSDWYRDIAEPMVCEYLERQFPSFGRVFWASEIPGGDRLDRGGVDGVVSLKDPEGRHTGFLGVQISTASLQEPHGRKVWVDKFRTWQRNPLWRLNGEAPAIGAKEGDPIPIVFVRMHSQDLEHAWENTPHGDWREREAHESARTAATKLPQSPRFQKEILDAMWLSLETLNHVRPELARTFSDQRDALSRERERVTAAIETKQ